MELYQGLPAAVDAYTMPNGAVVGLVKLNSSETRVEVFSGEYANVKGELRNRTFDYMLPIYPSHPTSDDEIDATVRCHIEDRLREIDLGQYLKDVVQAIRNGTKGLVEGLEGRRFTDTAEGIMSHQAFLENPPPIKRIGSRLIRELAQLELSASLTSSS